MQNRGIKFRAWNPKSKEMFNVSGIDLGLMTVISDQQEWGMFKCGRLGEREQANCQLMQLTGLKDKKEKDIYEGDLIRVCNNKNGCLLVEFKNDYVGGWVLTHPSEERWLSLGARKVIDIEIMGNIFENPELLNTKP